MLAIVAIYICFEVILIVDMCFIVILVVTTRLLAILNIKDILKPPMNYPAPRSFLLLYLVFATICLYGDHLYKKKKTHTHIHTKLCMMEDKKIAVLFVCLGNICRSPMAEAVFRNYVSESDVQHRFSQIDSCGTGSWHIGSTPDRRSSAECQKNGVPVNHRARRLTQEDFYIFDYILAMDESNLRDINHHKPRNSNAKVLLFGNFRTNNTFGRIVEDPYYGGKEGFAHNFRQLQHFSEVFVDQVVNSTLCI